MIKPTTIRLTEKDLETIEAIKNTCGYEGNAQTIRGALCFYNNYLSRRDVLVKLSVYQTIFEVTSDFVDKKGLYEEWREAIWKAKCDKYDKPTKKTENSSLEAVKTPNKGD